MPSFCAGRWVWEPERGSPLLVPGGWDAEAQAGVSPLALAEAWLCSQFTARSLPPNCTISAWCLRAGVRMDGLQSGA